MRWHMWERCRPSTQQPPSNIFPQTWEPAKNYLPHPASVHQHTTELPKLQAESPTCTSSCWCLLQDLYKHTEWQLGGWWENVQINQLGKKQLFPSASCYKDISFREVTPSAFRTTQNWTEPVCIAWLPVAMEDRIGEDAALLYPWENKITFVFLASFSLYFSLNKKIKGELSC